MAHGESMPLLIHMSDDQSKSLGRHITKREWD